MMESQQINPGDVVRLKSGGPLMTVHSTDMEGNGNRSSLCLWFPECGEGRRFGGTGFEIQRTEVACRLLEVVLASPPEPACSASDAESPAQPALKTALAEQIHIQLEGLAILLEEARKKGYLVDVHTDTGWVELPKIVSARIFQLLNINPIAA